jgi:hypothetical protein
MLDEATLGKAFRPEHLLDRFSIVSMVSSALPILEGLMDEQKEA